MDAFPAFFPLKGARVAIAGEGEPAEARARLLADSPAEVVRLAGAAALRPGAYAGVVLAFVASRDEAFARAACASARAAGAKVNVFDRPGLSDFHAPAIIDRGAVVVAVGTAGAAPFLAQSLRADLETRIPETVGALAMLLGARRKAILETFPDMRQRRAFLRGALAGQVAQAIEAGDPVRAGEWLDQAIAAGGRTEGRVVLIGMPSAPDLLSLRAQRAIASADVVVASAAAAPLAAAHARREAERLEEADAAIVAAEVGAGKLVVAIDPPPELARGLAAAGVVGQTLAPAPS